MCIFVLFTDADIDRIKKEKIHDDDIRQILNQVNEIEPNLILSEDIIFTKKGWGPFKSIVKSTHYTLYYVDQEMSTCQELVAGSGNKGNVISYMYGFLSGYDYGKK